MLSLTSPKIIFGLVLKTAAALVACLCCCVCAFSADATDITGKVVDATGKPIVDATVLVYHAGPTTGYSIFCPSCYADCGKRAGTDANGAFSLHRLSSGLWFKLLVARTGFEPKFIDRVIPSADETVTARLDARPKVIDPKRIFRGRIVDSNGLAERDAVVQLVGAQWDPKAGGAMGEIPGVDPIAATDERGVFEIDSFFVKQEGIPWSGAPVKILVSIEARGKAQAFRMILAGLEPQEITVGDGALVRGRLVQDGKPIGGAEIGLIGYPRGGTDVHFEIVGSPYEELRIGTKPDGTFEIPNVPVPGNWFVYAKMDSVASRGATGNLACATKTNREVVELGDVQLEPAYRLRGRVVLSDSKPIPDGMRVTISSEKAFDTQTATLPSNGAFEFIGLAADSYSIFTSVKGYSPEGDRFAHMPPISIEHDVDNFTVTLLPDGGAPSKSNAAGKPDPH